MGAGKPLVLGLAASHNGAACLLRGTELVVAVQEERLVRKKRAPLDPGVEFAALDYVLAAGGVGVAELDLVALCPVRDAAGAATRLAAHPRLGARPACVVSHHRAHAAAAWAQSGFAEAVVLVVDGAGSLLGDLPADERALFDTGWPDNARETVSVYHANDGGLTPLHKQAAREGDLAALWADGDLRPRMMPFTSLGIMYQSVAQQIFGQWDAAGKVMGLAPYGAAARPTADFFAVQHDGQLDFLDRVQAAYRTGERWPARAREYTQLAADVQHALEDGVLALVARARALSGSRRLCYAGGVALNSVANTRLVAGGGFDEVFIMPAAEDNGTAVGAAYLGWQQLQGGATPWVTSALACDAAGRQYSRADITTTLAAHPLDGAIAIEPGSEADLCALAAQLLDEGRVVGWFHGPSELGPRALGQRSILLDPRLAHGKELLNTQVKRREAFRPYAPAILEEHAAEWFELPRVGARSPFMLEVWRFRPEQAARVPAVVHVDGTGRVQTVGAANGRFRRLIEAFHRRTGVPLVLNTSFNVAGEPIVESPADALRGFAHARLDALVLEDLILRRS